jgi:ATP/maltotriose-dependent transcriptional regulator MalT
LVEYAQAEAILDATSPSGGGEQPAVAWWNEWVQLQLDRMWCHYWTEELSEMHQLATRVGPELEAHGSSSQQARFFQALSMMLMRQHRYRITDEAIVHARRAVQISRAAGLADIGTAHFVLGFALLFRGALSEALDETQAALDYAETVGDVPLQCRCHAYLGVIHRRLGEVGPTEQASNRTLALAAPRGLDDYVGAALGNLSWLAWRKGDAAEAEGKATAAWEAWARNESRSGKKAPLYPFQGLASWTMLDVLLRKGNVEGAVEAAQRMLHESQQRLADALQALLSSAVERWKARADESGVRSTLEEAVNLARAEGHL